MSGPETVQTVSDAKVAKLADTVKALEKRCGELEAQCTKLQADASQARQGDEGLQDLKQLQSDVRDLLEYKQKNSAIIERLERDVSEAKKARRTWNEDTMARLEAVEKRQSARTTTPPTTTHAVLITYVPVLITCVHSVGPAVRDQRRGQESAPDTTVANCCCPGP